MFDWKSTASSHSPELLWLAAGKRIGRRTQTGEVERHPPKQTPSLLTYIRGRALTARRAEQAKGICNFYPGQIAGFYNRPKMAPL